MQNLDEWPRAADSHGGCFPLPPELRDAPPRFVAAIRALVARVMPDAAPNESARVAGFFGRLFGNADILPLVALMHRRGTSLDGRPFLHEVAAALGLGSKQELKSRLAFAVACCPEIRAIIPRTSLTFSPFQERRLAKSLADGATFPGKLERTPTGRLRSPVGSADHAPRP